MASSAVPADIASAAAGSLTSGRQSPRQLPTGPPWTTVGASLRWVFRPLHLMESCQSAYGDRFTVKFLYEGPTVFLSNPADVARLFTAEPGTVSGGEGRAWFGLVFGSRSLVVLDGEDHLTQRRLVMPAYHGDHVATFGDLISEVADEHVQRWPRKQPIELVQRMRAISLDVIMRASLGVRDPERLVQLRQSLRRVIDWTSDYRRMIPIAMMGPGLVSRLRLLEPVMRPLNEALAAEIRQRRREDDLGERGDMLSMMVQARDSDGRQLDDAELRDELVTLMIAGNETTGMALAWAIERLVRHPEAMEQLHRDAQTGDNEYFDAVVKETLRLRPVVLVMTRLLNAPLELEGATLPAGIHVAACPYLLHRRADVYPEPERFRPERFIGSPAGEYTWIPFGGGTHRCVGCHIATLEMKIVLQRIFKQVRLRALAAEPERMTRRGLAFGPQHNARVIADSI
jgi:cytochrome P450